VKPQHHLDATTLLGYSAGTLPAAFASVAAVHLGYCAECREQLRNADRAGAMLLLQQEPAALSAGSREAMRQRLAAPPPPPAAVPATLPVPADLLPLPLRTHFGDTYNGLRWRTIAPGVAHIRARPMDGGDLFLLRVAAGRSVPLHSHGGNELTVILRGAYDDALGHFATGDAADLDGETEHQPVTSPGTPCICVAATDAPLRFSGWLARTLQPLFGL
jgi:putative transcriptional regulator